MTSYSSPVGHQVIIKGNNALLQFQEPMISLSTSQLNGGIQEISSCFNHQLDGWISTTKDLPQESIREYFKQVAESLDLDYHSSTGLMTTASMKNATLVSDCYQDIFLFTLVTAGAFVNALRAGDPPSYYEDGYNNFKPVGGTINVILVIEASLSIETLARVPIIITEAKSAVLQDLGIKSNVSGKIATGTGTDGIIVACAKKHPLKLSDCGNHSQLGYLISKTVMKAIRESLIKEKLDYLKRKG